MVIPKRVVRTPSSRGTPVTPVTPRPRPKPTSERVGIALGLVIVGALSGALLVGLAGAHAPAASVVPSDAATDDAGAYGSDAPGDSVAAVSPILEALVPTTIDDSVMTIQSAVDATSLSSGSDGRALDAAVKHLGKDPSDLEIVYAHDESGTTDLIILGFRVDGLAVTELRTAILGAWLAANTPGVTSASLDWSGTAVTKVSYGDEAADEYVFIVGDSVFVLETVDATMAQGAAAAIVDQAKANASPAAGSPAAGSPAASFEATAAPSATP